MYTVLKKTRRNNVSSIPMTWTGDMITDKNILFEMIVTFILRHHHHHHILFSSTTYNNMLEGYQRSKRSLNWPSILLYNQEKININKQTK